MSGRQSREERGAETKVNLVAERVVIGALLNSETAFWACEETLQAQHFASEFHSKIFTAIRDLLCNGKKATLQAIVGRVGEEYDDGKSTVNYLGALLRDSHDELSPLDFVETIVDLWCKRSLARVCESGLKDLCKPEVNASDLLAGMQEKLGDIAHMSRVEPLKSIGQIARRMLSPKVGQKSALSIRSFDTGLSLLDELIGKIYPGDLGAIGGRQGDAKTVLLTQILLRASLSAPSILFEIEMEDESLAGRILSCETGISTEEIAEGNYDFYSKGLIDDAVANLDGYRLSIDDRPKLTFEQICDRCISAKRTTGLGMIGVDHLRLIKTNKRFQNKFDRMEWLTGEFKALSKELGIATVLLSQLTRASQRREDPAPKITDLDGGGALEQDADWVLANFRRDRWLETVRPTHNDEESKEFKQWQSEYMRMKGRIEIWSLKNRRRKDGEMREFLFNGRASRIEMIG
jgi:replicative DNA helicase